MATLRLAGRFGQLWQASKPPTQKDGTQLTFSVHSTGPEHAFNAVALSARGDLLAAVDNVGAVYVLHLTRQAALVSTGCMLHSMHNSLPILNLASVQ